MRFCGSLVLLFVIQFLRGQSSIPVVVHVVWYSPEENISEQQIFSQLDVLNRDFQALNDLSIVPPGFRSLIASADISFCLATKDPEGQPSSGILRRQTNIRQVASHRTGSQKTICYSELGGSDAWDPSRYLNIWVGSFGGLWVGEASPPESTLQNEDGIRIDPRYFGTTGTATPPYNLGHSLTHEIGHYLGLQHPWGAANDNKDCTQDDGIADTPLQSKSYFGECPNSGFTCGTPDMTMNFMNWTDDACLAMFTPGQKKRMQEVLQGTRKGLISGDNRCMSTNTSIPKPATSSLHVFPNPGSGTFTLIRSNKSEAAHLYTATGQWIRSIPPHQNSFELTGATPGLYILTCGNQQLKIIHLP